MGQEEEARKCVNLRSTPPNARFGTAPQRRVDASAPVSTLLLAKAAVPQKGSSSMSKGYFAPLAFAAMAALVSPAAAQVPPPAPMAPGTTKVGMLACTLSPSIGFIIASHQTMACRFTPSTPRPL